MKPYTYLRGRKNNNNNKKTKKMNKQEFLDKLPENNEEAVTQELLKGLNKTQLTNVKRSLALLMKLAYKTQYRELSLQAITDAVDLVEVLNME